MQFRTNRCRRAQRDGSEACNGKETDDRHRRNLD
jgi:hypothetical protein